MKTHPLPADWSPPSERTIKVSKMLLKPWEHLTKPQFYGIEKVPKDRPVMFIANHTLMGVLDAPFLFLEIFEKTGHFVRSMGDHFHFLFPGWRDFLMKFGVVDGTRENCGALMANGEPILIYPGGGREVVKHKGEAYKLLWKKRKGFARLAIEHGYAIVPVACVGAEECYKILLDEGEVLRALPFLKPFKKYSPHNDTMMIPIISGYKGTPLPKPQNFYFSFGDPIESLPFQSREDSEEAAFELREEARVALEKQIADLLDLRDREAKA